MTEQMRKPILRFKDEYDFLSNFYSATVMIDGILYPTSEHAYQAFKTKSMAARKAIASLEKLGDAKRAGRKLEMREDWDKIKDFVMFRVVLTKFLTHSALSKKLLSTYPVHLEEGNTWGDRYWGTVEGKGENRLGRTLMYVRDSLFNSATDFAFCSILTD